MTRIWSKNQLAIFDFTANGSGNAIVEAVAGSGKTTTIVEAMSRVVGRALFLAFNKSIATELKQRGVDARTFHSMVYGPVTRYYGIREVDMDKLRKVCRHALSPEDDYMYSFFISKLVGLARGIGIGCLVDDTEGAWYDLVAHHDLELENEKAEMTRAIELSRRVLAYSSSKEGIASFGVDFDDMLYLAVKDGLSLPKYDFVFVDEAQDTNPIQRAVLRKIFHPHTCMIAVGDPAQAIYGFRGADSESLAMIKEEFSACTLPLTVSYRCPVAVVNYVHQWVQHIEAAPGAPEGKVTTLGQWHPSILQPNDLVVCRTTAAIISLAFTLIKNRIPARVMGKEIGEQMKSLCRRMRANNIDHMLTLLEGWRDREAEKARSRFQDSLAESIMDRFDAIEYLVRTLDESERTLDNLYQTIDMLFADGIGKVILSTIHKAKGLEAKRVFWLNRSKCPALWARQPWQKIQEINLCYVAGTRAIEELIMFEMDNMQREKEPAEKVAL